MKIQSFNEERGRTQSASFSIPRLWNLIPKFFSNGEKKKEKNDDWLRGVFEEWLRVM